MKNILRQIKRSLLSGGFAKTVYNFLKEVEKEEGIFKHPEGRYLVNLSFDFELGLGTTFWYGDSEKALAYGKAARRNFVPIARYLRESNIPANIQIVGSLLEPSEHREPFRLTDEDLELLKSPNFEVGLHGYSHKHFTEISREEAEYEMKTAVKNFENQFGYKPEFMAFPKNLVSYTKILEKYGIKAWRADNQHPPDVHEIPLGHWFSPGVLGRDDIKRLLSIIRNK